MDSRTLHRGLTALARADDELAQALAKLGPPPPPPPRPTGFESFLATIVNQQISAGASRAILSRVEALMPAVTAEALLALEDQALRGAGMSFRKIEYAKGLARAVLEGRFDIGGLAALPDPEAVAAITALRGFGRWSAEIYLMFALDRPDLFPADDLALRVALGRLKGLAEPPTPKQARDLVGHWRPWRSVGALFLWHYYRGAPA